MIPCRCGHHVNEHASVTRQVGEREEKHVAQCLVDNCKCEAYDSTRPLPDWMRVARMAEYARRHGLFVGFASSSKDRNRKRNWSLTLQSVDEQIDFNAPLQPNEAYEMYEMLSMQMAECASSIVDENPLKALVDARRLQTLGASCPTCGVLESKWCVPVHDGERACGGWVHPSRLPEVSYDQRIDERIVAWAFSAPTGDILPRELNASDIASVFRRLDIQLREARARLRVLEVSQNPVPPSQRTLDALREAVHRVDLIAAQQWPDGNMPETESNIRQYEQRVRQELREGDGNITIGNNYNLRAYRSAQADRLIVEWNTHQGYIHTYPSRLRLVHVGARAVAEARQHCTLCSGTGTSAGRPCSCAAGQRVRRVADAAAPLSQDGRSSLQRTRDRMTAPVAINTRGPLDAPVSSRQAEAERIRAGINNSGMGAGADCGCTWGSPCDEHGPYW